MKSTVFLVPFGICLLFVGTARSQEPTDVDSQGLEGAHSQPSTDAQEAFTQGKSLFADEKYMEAADAFRVANKLQPNWKLLYNIGQCEALSKRHGLALQAFEAYLSKGGDDIDTQRQTEVRLEVDRLRGIIGLVEIKAPDGAVVFIDGVERGVAPLAGHIPVAASVLHSIVLREEGEVIATRDVTVVGGQSAVVEFLSPQIAPEPALDPSPAEPSSSPIDNAEIVPVPVGPPPSSSARKWGLFTLSIGAGFLVAGTITGIMTAAKAGTLEDRCPDNQCTDGGDRDLKESVDRLALTTDILLPIGGVLAVTGIVLLAIDKKRLAKKESATARLVPVFSPYAGGLSIEGSF